MRGNKRTFPNFHICFLISMNSNSFQIQNPWAKMIWLLPFKLNEKVFENNWISFGNISIHKLHAAQWFSWEKIKWLLQIIWNMSWEFQRIKYKVFLELFFNLELFGFYSNHFFSKIKYMENKVTWFPTTKNWREINLISFWYFQNDFCWILLEQEHCWNY